MVFHLKGPSHSAEGFSLPSVLSPQRPAFEGIVSGIMEVIHLPGLRGNPERTYPVTAVGQTFRARLKVMLLA